MQTLTFKNSYSDYCTVRIQCLFCSFHIAPGGEIAQSLASLSVKRAVWVRARLDLFVSERWNSITILLTRSHQCQRLVKKRPAMCYYVCVIMHVKDPQLSVIRVGHCVPLAGFCLPLYSLHVLNRDINMILNKPYSVIIYIRRNIYMQMYVVTSCRSHQIMTTI